MLRVLVLLLIASCEQAPTSTPTPEPAPVPVPAPVPPPIKRTVPSPERDEVVIRVSPTEIRIGSAVIALTSTSSADQIAGRVEALLKGSTYRRAWPVLLETDSSVEYARILAIMDGVKRAGFDSISLSVP